MELARIPFRLHVVPGGPLTLSAFRVVGRETPDNAVGQMWWTVASDTVVPLPCTQQPRRRVERC